MARNLSDGRVEVIAEGPKDRLETLVTRLRKGPSAALVQQVVEDWGEYQHEYDSFQIEYT
jgi:acylphosphatase